MKKIFVLGAVILLSGCASLNWDWNWNALNPWAGDDTSIMEKEDATVAEPQLPASVNKYLWQASLDKLSFMGVESKSTEDGTITTQWKILPETANEKFKVVAEINGGELRADALDVKVYKEVKSGDAWIKTAPSDGLESDIEQAIIKQAKILYINDKNKE